MKKAPRVNSKLNLYVKFTVLWGRENKLSELTFFLTSLNSANLRLLKGVYKAWKRKILSLWTNANNRNTEKWKKEKINILLGNFQKDQKRKLRLIVYVHRIQCKTKGFALLLFPYIHSPFFTKFRVKVWPFVDAGERVERDREWERAKFCINKVAKLARLSLQVEKSQVEVTCCAYIHPGSNSKSFPFFNGFLSYVFEYLRT